MELTGPEVELARPQVELRSPELERAGPQSGDNHLSHLRETLKST